MSRRFACTALALILSGCGGSNTGVQPISLAPVTPPTPTPTPVEALTPISQEAAPPALPAITSGTLADALKSNADFRTGSVELKNDIRNTYSSSNKAYDSASSIRVYYDAATARYIVSNIIGTAHRFPDGYPNYNPGFDSWGQNALDGVRRLRVLTPSAQNPKIALTYTSFGIWQFDSSDRTNIDPQINDYHFFYFGIPTPTDSIPRTGSARYTGIAEGALFALPATYRLSGTMTLDADFAMNSITTKLSLGAANTANGLLIIVPELTGAASITRTIDHFQGTISTVDGSYTGSIRGTFFGPNAEEVGYSFGINSPDLLKIGGGVAVGKR